MRNSILIFLAYISVAIAFTINPSAFRIPTVLFAGESDKEGGAAIAKPKVGVKVDQVTKQKAKSVEKKKAKSGEPVNRRDDDFEDAPMFKVILVGDDSYDQTHVIQRMCEVLEKMDESQAASIYKQAQQGGSAMCGKYPLEHAEMYKEQLIRSDPMIYADVQKE